MTKIFLTAILGAASLAPINEVSYSSYAESSAKIYYSKERKLTWADFVKTNKPGDVAAVTVSEISYELSSFKGKYEIGVICVFHKNLSYCNRSNNTAYILNHEQRHFDISYIFAIYLKKRLASEKNLTIQRANEIYDKIISEWENFQELYDSETNHSINKTSQEKWDKHIDKLLNES
jgi:hypothetical protein